MHSFVMGTQDKLCYPRTLKCSSYYNDDCSARIQNFSLKEMVADAKTGIPVVPSSLAVLAITNSKCAVTPA